MSQVLVPLAFPENFPQNSLVRAAIVITLFSSAYMAENVRGGLQSLHPGQAEAARALGLPVWQTTLFISLPQALRNVIPAIVGQFIFENIRYDRMENRLYFVNQFGSNATTDQITIFDGYVINFGVVFDIIARPEANKDDVKLKCI